MKRWTICVTFFVAVAAHAQTVSLSLQQKQRMAAPGATAAFALDPSCVDAQLEKDALVLVGKRPCATKVMVVSAEDARSLHVQVTAKNPPVDSARRGAFSGAFAEGGSYSFRFQSGPARFENAFDFTRRQGERTVRIQFAAASTPSGFGGSSPVNLHVMSYQLTSARQELTLLDRSVEASPLTVSGLLVRGMHLRRGDWFVHTGYTSLGSYQDLFFPTQREFVFGAGRRFRLSKHSALTPMLFYFSTKDSAWRAARPGPVGSLLYEYQPTPRFRLLGELGFSRGLAGYFQLNYQGGADDVAARLRIEPGNFPALRANNRHGFYSDVRWTHHFSRALRTNLFLSANRFLLPGFEQSNLITNAQVQYSFARVWNLQGGWDFSSFTGRVPASSRVRSMSFPVSLGIHARRAGGTLLYRFSRNSQNELGSHQLRESLYTRWRGFHLSAFHDRQTMAPTVDLILSQFPALEQALLQDGITATSPQQIAALLRENRTLWSLGLIEGVNIFLSPVRTQYGANINWSSPGKRKQQFQYSVLFNNHEGLRLASRAAIHRASYSLQLSPASELYVAASWYQSRTAAGTRPLLSVGFRRRFAATPAFLLPGKKGLITGRVFVDKEQRGVWHPGAEPVADAEVILDGARRTRTDQDGRYVFKGVSQGGHEVEVIVKQSRPFFFTTPSRVEADINSEVNFGLSFEKARLFGRVLSDAGIGVFGVAIRARNAEYSFDASTAGDGSFQFAGLPDGEFEIQVVPESVPPGYRLQEDATQRLRLEAGTPAQVEFRLQALRSFSGRVLLRTRPSSRPQPVAGALVRIAELNLECTTDTNGAYLFRNLPAGDFTLIVLYEQREISRKVTIPASPGSLKNVDIQLSETSNLHISQNHLPNESPLGSR
jgi:hypothetical protein